MIEMPENTASAPESREIRVFLSRTFRDFIEEQAAGQDISLATSQGA
jgi:hypothetical protein